MSLLEQIKDAGVVGCGGAGFPTHVKLKGRFTYLIVNGAECEPMLQHDQYLMRHKAPELVEAVSAITSELNIPHAVIALKRHYKKEIVALRKAIEHFTADISICELENFYPAGDEQNIVYEVTGRVVPPGGIPGKVGAMVDNVGTVYAIYEALHKKPFTHKYLTVAGEVGHPVILRVPIGTSFRHCLDLAGTTRLEEAFVLDGGPMMGRVAALDKAVVTKTTGGILALPPESCHARRNAVDIKIMLNRARSACIQCASCTQLCPRHLLGHPLQPHRIMRKMALGGDAAAMLEDPDLRNAQLCCECGVCEVYACPMGLQPRKINTMVKQEFAAAGIRYQRSESGCVPSSDREGRKVPVERITARMGLGQVGCHNKIDDLVCGEAESVSIPLKMHIGAAAVPTVFKGDRVAVGDLIVHLPEGMLGAAVQASIDAGRAVGWEHVVDYCTIPHVASQVIRAINMVNMPKELGAVGILEFYSVTASLYCADAAVKAAGVELLDLRLGTGIGGKSFVILTGEVTAVREAVACGSFNTEGMLVSSVVVPSPHPELLEFLL